MMTEDMKLQIVRDTINSRWYQPDDYDKARYLMRLIRALDNYRERDDKGRFVQAVRGEI